MHTEYKGYYAAAIILSLALGLSCGNGAAPAPVQTGRSGITNTPHPSWQGNSRQVIVRAGSFDPPLIIIGVGDTVLWLNADSAEHTVTAVYHFQDEDDVSHIFIGEAWDSGGILPGKSYSRIFDHSGTFEYLSLPLHTSYPLEQYYQFAAQNTVGVVVVK